MREINKVIYGGALEEMRKMEAGSVDCIVTSPPYWQLRKYGDNSKELGQEKTFEEFVENLALVFDEAKRVLKKTGTCFVNISDTYGTQSGAMRSGKFGKKNTNNQQFIQPKAQHKSLCLIPYRFAIAMTDRGWICRNVCIWWKRNAMPSSAKDRFTVDYEPILFFVKNKKYFWKNQFENYANSSEVRYRQALRAGKSYAGKMKEANDPEAMSSPRARYKRGTGSVASRGDDADGLVVGGKTEGRNMRTVWDIPTEPSPVPHFAMYPEKLASRMILSGCPKGGVVLDPFAGAGNTLTSAKKLGMNYVGIELYEENCTLAQSRLSAVTSSLF